MIEVFIGVCLGFICGYLYKTWSVGTRTAAVKIDTSAPIVETPVTITKKRAPILVDGRWVYQAETK